MREPESESDSSESETEELFYPKYMLPLQRKHRSNFNGSKSVSSNKEKSHVSVHGDTFNSSGGLNRSDSSVVFNRSDSLGGFIRVQVVVLLVQMYVPLAVPEISVEVL